MNKFTHRWQQVIHLEMTRIVRWVLVGVMILGLGLVWTPPVMAATYTPLQQSQIQKFSAELQTASDRMPELGNYVVEDDWTNIRNFIHGPLGEIRRYMANINRNRPPKEQRKARSISQDLMGHIERLDAAAKDENSRQVKQEYAGTLEDLKLFLDSVPQF